jgi:polyhydroxyalkanoate synthesis repressor PhaR
MENKRMEFETIIIKRYANRKLYDTVQKEYITLNGLSKLIREGAEIQVIDNESGEDLTARTLTQIILEQENLGSSLISKSFLTNLIRTGEDQIATLQRNFQSSLGSWRQIDEEIRDRVQALVKKGELTAIEAEKIITKLISQSPIGRSLIEENNIKKNIDEKITSISKHKLIPTREDINQLIQQLDELEEKIEHAVQSKKEKGDESHGK